MSNNPTNSATALERIFDLIEDELLRASGEELDDMARAWGVDSSRATDVVGTAFKGALQVSNRNRLRDARKQAEVEVGRLRATASDAPGTREELVARITTLLAARNARNPSLLIQLTTLE